MAKKPTVTTLQSGFNSTEVLNQNFEALRDAFDNTLSLDGSTPNYMEADLDLNGNNIIGAGSIVVGGQDLLASTQANLSAAAVAQAAADAAVTAAEISETNAATSATSASTSASNAATSASQAASSALAASGSATASATSALAAENAETNAETAETNAAASAAAALASETAAAASEAGVDADRVAAQAAAAAAAASETAAATSETNAATSETNAANSATASASSATASAASATAASASETAAAASETAAAASETAAATSETNAATSATTATTKASEASASATAAASSASASATSATDSEAARDQSQDARDTANLHKLAAEAAATSATNTASALTGFDLEAIAASKAVTAVDVFVYDTSKDSDGGAWRKRTQGTSWYNETLNTATRGSRREFPAVAVIVAENYQVTIYDGDDPDLPMWIKWTDVSLGSNKPITSVAMLNGILCWGSDDGNASSGALIEYNFLKETRYYFGWYGNTYRLDNAFADRNGDGTNVIDNSRGQIIQQNVNDVAMTVLPDAPIDPATGLPVPTIAVGTAAGTSVINDNGTVTDASNVGSHNFVVFTEHGLFVGDDAIMEFATFEDIRAGDGWGDIVANAAGTVDIQLVNRIRTDFTNVGNDLASSGNTTPTGSQLINIDYNDFSKSMVAYTTSTYNTGWMNGDIKLATLSDTDATDVTGSELAASDNTFSNWSVRAGGGGSFTINGDGTVSVVNGDNVTPDWLDYSIPTVVGKTYTIDIKASGTSGTGLGIYINYTGGPNGYVWNRQHTFVATGTNTAISLYRYQGHVGSGTLTSVSVRLAEEDRSVNGNGLQVFGTVTKTPVATGADLVAYSGFSTSNYLEQPYNSDLDFGTGDFCVMGWFKAGSTTSNQTLFSKHDGAAATLFQLNTFSGALNFYSSGWKNSGYSPSVGVWESIVVTRKSGVLYIYAGGILKYSVASTDNYTLAASTLRFGVNHLGTWPLLSGGSLALWRISATAPTAEQIAKIYNDEKVLFQENAQATLYGSSDAVTALAHDDATDLLHVGTSAGRSVFQGLRRVSNTTTAVGNAISASNNLIVEE